MIIMISYMIQRFEHQTFSKRADANDQSKAYGDVLVLGTTAFSKTSGTYANSESATAVVLSSANSMIGITQSVVFTTPMK